MTDLRIGQRALCVIALAAGALLAPSAAGASHSYPATYTGNAGGGTVDFDVSADGASITRFALQNVATSCFTASLTFMGAVPIVNHSFSQSSGTLHFSGSFPASQQASGTLSLHPFGCTSAEVPWSATTSAPPPSGSSATGGTPGDDCTKASRAVMKARKAYARKGRKLHRTPFGTSAREAAKKEYREARARLTKAIKKSKRACRPAA